MKNEQRAGIIDTISLGYGLVTRRPWLIVLPVLLDLFFWLGPRLSMQPTVDAVTSLLAAQGGENAGMLDALRRMGTQSDLFMLLAVQIPSLIRWLDPATSSLPETRPVVTLTGMLATFAVALLLLAAGLLLSMLYLAPIAQVVRSGGADMLRAPRLAGRAWLRLLLLVALLSGVALVVIVPLSALAAVTALAGLNLLAPFSILLQVAVIWLFIYLYFVINAILVSDVGPLQAIRNSIAVVRHNFWASLGLMLLSALIVEGLTRVFRLFTGTPVGIPLAIVANAYIGSGLAAASMIFYRDRLARLTTVKPNA